MCPQQAVGNLHSGGKRQAGDLPCDFGRSCWTPASQSHRCLVKKEPSISHKPRQTWRSLKVHRKQVYSMYSSISWKMLLATTWGANLGRFLAMQWGTAFPADGRDQDSSQTPFLREKRAGTGCRAKLGSLKDRDWVCMKDSQAWKRQPSRLLCYYHNAFGNRVVS